MSDKYELLNKTITDSVNEEIELSENVGLLNDTETNTGDGNENVDSSDNIEINVISPENQILQQKRESNRIYWIDCLRIYACYIVVITHASWYFLNRQEGTWQQTVANFYQGSTRACVPFFIMISGIFFLKPTKNLPYKVIFTKYIYRIFKCYIFWCIFYALVYRHFIYAEFSFLFNKKDLIDTIRFCLLGSDHLWYLNFVMGLYILTPIYRAITADRDLAKYTVLICSIACQIVPSIVHLVTFYLKFEQITILRDFFNKLQLEMAGSYSVYYILGYLLSTYEFKKRRNIYLMYGVGILGTFLTTFFYIYNTIKQGKLEAYMINFNCFNVAMSTVGGFLFFKYTINDWIQPFITKKWFTKTINVLSECSFGIYLWHLFILRVLNNIGFNGNKFAGFEIETAFGIPIVTTMDFIICLIITYIMRKIPILKEFT